MKKDGLSSSIEPGASPQPVFDCLRPLFFTHTVGLSMGRRCWGSLSGNECGLLEEPHLLRQLTVLQSLAHTPPLSVHQLAVDRCVLRIRDLMDAIATA